MHTSRLSRIGYDERSAAMLVMPVFVVLALVAIFPIVYSFYTSLFDINLTRPLRRPFVGLDNYVKIFSDPVFWTAVWRTTVYTVVTVTVTTLLALATRYPAQRDVSRAVACCRR